MDRNSTMTPRFARALLTYVQGTLTDPSGVDEPTMLSLYNLRGEALDAGLRVALEAMIRRVEKRGDRYHLSSESLKELQRQEVI